jgi:plastocyanin
MLAAPSRRALLCASLAALLLGPARAAETEVRIDNFVFSPAEITIAPGTTVTWLNADDIPHTVVAEGGAFRSKPLDTDDRFATRFDRPGTYRYFCSLHPHMVGTVVVRAGDGPAP